MRHPFRYDQLFGGRALRRSYTSTKVVMIVKPISAAVTAALTVATPAATQQARHWTLEDQLSIPEVGGLSISAAGHSAFYVVRVADLASRRMVAVRVWKSVVLGKRVDGSVIF